MKKYVVCLFVVMVLLGSTGCEDGRKAVYLPKASNDKIYTTVGGESDGKQSQQGELSVVINGEKTAVQANLHQGSGYTLYIPEKGYRYEKDYDDGRLEETWESIAKDDVELKVTTYENADQEKAQSRFLNDKREYVFEDLMGYPLCGLERDGDTLWFHLYEADGTVYIVSWEYPKFADDDSKAELSAIAESFATTQ